jgi:hypothetical protein
MPGSGFSNAFSLEQFDVIAGTEFTIEYKVFDQNGSPANISPYDCYCYIAKYGDYYDGTAIYLTGTKTSTDTFEVLVMSTDTLNFSGTFVHQPVIDDGGTTQFRSQQGLINFYRAI